MDLVFFNFKHEYFQDKCVAKNKKDCEFEYSSVYLEQYNQLRVYFHVIDGKDEKCPEVSVTGIGLKRLIPRYRIRFYNKGHKEIHSYSFQVYTMAITLGIFGFLLLVGIVTILAFLGLYRLNDARAYAKYVIR